MKIYYVVSFVACVILNGCRRESSLTYETKEIIQPPTEKQVMAIDSVSKAEEAIIEKIIPADIIEKKKDLREEKEERSIFQKEGCCANEAPPVICCCEPVLIKYQQLLAAGNAAEVAQLRAEDPILNDCYKKNPSFKQKLDEIEMSDSEE